MIIITLATFFIIYLLAGLRVVYEYQAGVKFTLGKYSGLVKPGLTVILLGIQKLKIVDLRVTTVDIPAQEVMSSDNVPVKLNGVVYFNIIDPEKSVLKIRDYRYAIAQLSQTTIKDVAGGLSLDELLKERDQIAENIKQIVDKETDPWGININSIKLQDIELPPDLKRTMAKQAEAERERRAVVIKSVGEVQAAQNLAKAAKILSSEKGALHLRTLQTINDISSDPNSKVILPIPLDLIDYFKKK